LGIWKKDLIAVRHDDSDVPNADIIDMMMHYRLMYTELGSCYSYLHQLLPSGDDFSNLEKSIEKTQTHNLFDGHAYGQHKRLGGIGAKLEDFAEKGHQLGIRDVTNVTSVWRAPYMKH
jgi:hypothetical protein